MSKIIIGLIALLLAASPAVAQSFAPPVSYTVGANPSGVAFRDINNDGQLDLISVNNSGASVSVLLGMGGTTFGPKTDYPIGSNGSCLVLSDFNGDHKVDIATGNSFGLTSNVSILLGNGDGTFMDKTDYALNHFANPSSIAAGDFTGDGKPEVITSNQGGGATYWLNNGNGNFVDSIVLDAGSFASGVALGDFNQDSKLDVAVSSYGGNHIVSIFLGNGNGTFQTPTKLSAGPGPIKVITADLNGDGKLDLITANTQGASVGVLLGNGDGTFQSAVNYPANLTPFSLAPADFNADGKLDLAIGNNGGGFSLLLGNGDGSFGRLINFQVSGSVVSAADFNNDGLMDVGIPSAPGQVGLFLNQFGPHTISGLIVDALGVPLSGASVVLTGAIPIVFTTGSDGAYYFGGLPNGGSFVVTPTKTNYVLVPSSKTFNNLAANQVANFKGLQPQYSISGVVRDLSGAGIGGVSVSLTGSVTASTTTASDGSYSFPANPAGGIYSVSVSLAGLTLSPATLFLGNLVSPRTVNFTGSPITYRISGKIKNSLTNFALFGSFVTLSSTDRGRLTFPASEGQYFFSDLQAGNTYTVTVGTIQGNAHFSRVIAPPPQTFANLNSDITSDFFGKILDFPSTALNSITSGDYNGDGKRDFVLGGNGTLQVYLANNVGLFANPVAYPVGLDPQSLVTADFNLDGKLDLANANSSSNSVSISLGNGDGTFAAAQNFATDNDPFLMISGDWNNDNNLDLATLNRIGTNNHTISILYGLANGTFSAATTFNSLTTVSLAAGDMDSDGDLDFVCGTNSNKINVLYRGANGVYTAGQDYAVPAIPSRVVVGDVNGDARPDIVTASEASSNVSVLLAVANAPFGNANSFPAGGNSNFLAIADFNNDGKLDLASSLTSLGTLVSLLGNGDGTFQAFVDNSGSGGPVGSLTVGDFNNDGKKDIGAIASNGASLFLNVIPDSAPVKISGTVTTPSGAPVAGVAITLGGTNQGSTSTDANGVYSFTNLRPGGWFLVSASKNFYTVTPQGRTFNDLKVDQVSNFTAALNTPAIFGRVTDANGLGLAGVSVNLSGSQTANVVTNANGLYSFLNLTAGGNYVVTPSYGSGGFAPANRSITNLTFDTTVDFRSSLERTIQLDAIDYTVNEGAGSVQVMVNRSGDISAAAAVAYSTTDSAGGSSCGSLSGSASSRCDYLTTVGVIQFAPGESSRIITIPIVDDGYVEGNETLRIALGTVSVGSLGLQTPATITIIDNDSANGPNPLTQTNFFVTQHYLDFLNRVPDSSGLAFWSNQITECEQPGASCSAEVRRINVSAAFFLSIEFQETGYLVERIYKSSYGDATGTSNFGPTHQLAVPIVRFAEFLPDTQQIGKDVVVGQSGANQQLEANKVVFTQDFVLRTRFATAYPTSLTPAQFVDQLFLNAGVVPTANDRTTAINDFGGAGNTLDTAARARALRRVAENSILNQQEKNRAFVLMQYFGYLRRNPNDPQDTDYTGYDFWLTKLNEFNGNFVSAEMVNAFIISAEYRQRFGQ